MEASSCAKMKQKSIVWVENFFHLATIKNWICERGPEFLFAICYLSSYMNRTNTCTEYNSHYSSRTCILWATFDSEKFNNFVIAKTINDKSRMHLVSSSNHASRCDALTSKKLLMLWFLRSRFSTSASGILHPLKKIRLAFVATKLYKKLDEIIKTRADASSHKRHYVLKPINGGTLSFRLETRNSTTNNQIAIHFSQILTWWK